MFRGYLVIVAAVLVMMSCASVMAANSTDWTKPFDADANTVLLFHFDENQSASTAADSSGNGINGTLLTGLANQADHYVAGQTGFGNAINITFQPGVNKKIDLPENEKLAFGGTDVTMEAWIRQTDQTNSIIYQNLTGGDMSWGIDYDPVTYVSGRMIVSWYSNGTWQSVKDENTIWENNVWNHAAVTWTRRYETGGESVITFWKNGVAVFSQDVTALKDPGPNPGPAAIGGRWIDGLPTYELIGQIDEFRLSNTIRYPEPVPEPGSVMALLVGVTGIAGLAVRKRSK